MVTGENTENKDEVEDQDQTTEGFWEIKRPDEGLRIEENKYGEYDCPEIILYGVEEQRSAKPWKKGLIVKMSGRRISYKAVENKLQQMPTRKWVLNIVDLCQEYYLVTFTSEEDQEVALIEGPR